jgi:PAS domain S-box-containing protein
MSSPGGEHEASPEVTELRRQVDALRRALAEEALKSSESRLGLIFHGVSDLLFLIGVEAGPQFRCLAVNHSYLKRTGWTQEQMAGKLIEEILPPEQAQCVIKKYTAAVQSRTPSTFEESAEVPAGRLVMETTLRPVFDGQGNCTHLLGASQDVTERKRMVKALHQYEARYRTVSELVSDYAYAVRLEPNGREVLEWVTEAFSRITGFSVQDLAAGVGLDRIIHPEDMPRVCQRLRVLLSGQPGVSEHRIITKSGEIRWLRDYSSPEWDTTQGRVVRIIGAGQDITEQKRVEEALRESEERYRNLFENANDALATFTLDGTITAVNHAMERLLGWSRAELLGQHVSKVATPASVAFAAERTWRFLIGERLPSSTFEAELISKDGRLMLVEARTRAIRNADGKPVGFQGIYRDVTERKRMEEALQASEEKYRTIFAASPDFIYLTDTEGNMLDANPALLKRAGLSLEHLRQRNVREFYAGGKPEELEQLLAELRSGHGLKGVEVKARSLAGEIWDYEINAIPLGNPGEVFLSVARDITERKRMEAALRVSAQRYRAVVETQTELVCRFLPDTTLTFVNEAYCRSFGKSREELLGTSFLSLIPEPARSVVKARLESLIAQPRLVISEHEVIAAGGDIGWQQWTDQGILDDTGRLTEFQSTGLDITERKRAEEALQQLQAELAHVSRVSTIGEMTASIAHEVNQPLGAIVGNADLCLRWLTREPPDLVQVRDALCDIITDGHRASEVIARIRALIKKEHSPKTRCDMNEIIGETIALASYEMRRKHITLRTELAPDLPPVFGDYVQLGQVVLNLIMNGIEAMSGVEGRARELTLRSGRSGAGGVLITVRDCGVGINPDEVKQIFAAFYTTKPGGIGMGLAICRSIVEAHGGRLWARPTAGPGATFHFTLPADSEGR